MGKSRLKICIASQQFRNIYSGVGLYTKNVVNFLAQQGHDVTLIVPRSQSLQSPYQNLVVHTVPDALLGRNQARWMFLSLSFSRLIAELEQETTYDLIHFTDARESFFCPTKAPAIGNLNDTYSAELMSPGYYRAHYSDWFTRWGYYSLVHQLERTHLPRLAAIIANSDFTAQISQKAYAMSALRWHVCHKSVDVARYEAVAQARLASSAPVTSPVVLFVGGNMQRKGLPDLIRAAPAVLARFPETSFVVVGTDPAQPGMVALSEELKVSKNFKFLGWQTQDDLLSILANSTIFALPSLTEALGVAFLEAMAAGVPVIGTSVGGIPEIIQDGANGLLVPPGQPAALSEALLTLLSDTGLRRRLTLAGLETVKDFTVEKMMACTLGVYTEVTGRSVS